MLRYIFFLMFSMYSLVYSTPNPDDDFKYLLYVQQSKKNCKELSIYLNLISFHQDEPYFVPHLHDFSELVKTAHKLLEEHKKLSYLSIEYSQYGKKQNLPEIRTILSNDSNNLSAVINRAEKLLSHLHLASDQKNKETESLCESYKGLEKLYESTAKCIDVKNYSCVNELLSKLDEEKIKYEQCVNKALKELNLPTRWNSKSWD